MQSLQLSLIPNQMYWIFSTILWQRSAMNYLLSQSLLFKYAENGVSRKVGVFLSPCETVFLYVTHKT